MDNTEKKKEIDYARSYEELWRDYLRKKEMFLNLTYQLELMGVQVVVLPTRCQLKLKEQEGE